MTHRMTDGPRHAAHSPKAASKNEGRYWAGALGFLALVVAATVGIAVRGSTVGIDVTATPAPNAVVSGRSRIVLTFPTAMRTESVEGRLTVVPETATGAGDAVRGHWTWETGATRSDRVAQFIPTAPLTPGVTYRVTLPRGATATNGRSVQGDRSWSFAVRAATLLFLRVNPTDRAAGRQLWSADADGGNLRQITQEPGGVLEFSPAPDGARIAYTTQEGPQITALWAINSDGTGHTRLSPTGDPSGYATPAWSPAGDVIAYVLRGVIPNGTGGITLGTSKLWAVTPDGNALGRIYGRGDEVGFAPVWSPDGTHLAFREQVDAQNNAAVVLSDLSPNPVKIAAGPGSRIAWSPDGTRAAYDENTPDSGSGGGSRVVIVSADGAAQYTLGGADAAAPDWSPDGTRLVFASRAMRADGSPTVDIAVARVDGIGGVRRLFGGDGLTSADPAWSPDGQTIIATRFSARTGDDRGLWRVDADGTDARLVIAGGERAVWVP